MDKKLLNISRTELDLFYQIWHTPGDFSLPVRATRKIRLGQNHNPTGGVLVSYALRTLCLITVLILPATAMAQSGSRWKLPKLPKPKLNPFKKNERKSNLNSFVPSLPKPGSPIRKKPTITNRLTKGPKKLLKKSKRLIPPWKSNQRKIRGFRQKSISRTALKPKRKKRNWNPVSWFRREKPSPPTSAADFLSRKAPGF